MSRKVISFVDYIIIAAVLILAAVVFGVSLFGKASGKTVVISVNNEVIEEIDLSGTYEKRIETENGYNTVKIEQGKCRVISADCRDGICKSRGGISKMGESIVCLPHRLIVEIK